MPQSALNPQRDQPLTVPMNMHKWQPKTIQDSSHWWTVRNPVPAKQFLIGYRPACPPAKHCCGA